MADKLKNITTKFLFIIILSGIIFQNCGECDYAQNTFPIKVNSSIIGYNVNIQDSIILEIIIPDNTKDIEGHTHNISDEYLEIGITIKIKISYMLNL